MIWQLTAKGGPKRGESWAITERPLTVGRSLNCDISIEDPTVSRRHCQIYLEGSQVVFRDLGSRNVSLVNGTVVAECRLVLGDELSIGDSAFILTRIATPRPRETPISADITPPTISLGRALLDGRETAEAPAAAYPTTAQEVVQIFQFGRRLSRATCEEVYASVCVQEMETLFPADVSKALWCGGGSGAARYPASFEPDEDVVAHVRAAMEAGSSSLARHQRRGLLFQDQVFSCVAPLIVSGQCRGALLVQATARQHVLNDTDLARLDGLAQAAAPFQIWRSPSGTDTENMLDASLEQLAMVGESETGELSQEIQSASQSGRNTLVTGRNHAAVALTARLIHTRSPRAHGPFVTADCESILGPGFIAALTGGPAAGRLTGHAASSPGLLERSCGGTLVLGNLEVLSEANQVELLQLLRRGTYVTAGAPGTRTYRGRIIATTSVELEERARRRRFNAELLAILGSQCIRIRSLEDLGSDQAAPDQHGRAANLIHQAKTTHDAPHARRGGKRSDGYHDSAMDALENAEKTLIRAVLAQCDGDVQRAAKVFGIPPGVLRPLVTDECIPPDERKDWHP